MFFSYSSLFDIGVKQARAYPELVWRCYFNQGAKTPDQFQICSQRLNEKKQENRFYSDTRQTHDVLTMFRVRKIRGFTLFLAA